MLTSCQAMVVEPRESGPYEPDEGSGKNTSLLDFSHLKNVTQVFGGGPLSKDVGDFLVSKGVCLYTLYALYVIPTLLNNSY